MGDGFILCYHRVVETLPPDPYQLLAPYDLCVDVRRFRQHMEYVARRYHVVPLDELVAALPGRHATRPMVAITFDDGYADNYEHALPVLRRVGIPATVFLATGNIDSGAAFWWDRLAWHLPRYAGRRLPAALAGGEPDVVPETSEELSRLYGTVHSRLRVLDASARDAALDALGDGAGDAPRPLTWAEARRMVAAGISLGGHSVSHPSLVALSDTALRDEVGRCREVITAQVGAAPATFAYPFGHVDDRVAAAVEAAGYRAAVTVRWARCDADVPYWLPRLLIANAERQSFIDTLRWVPGAAGAAPRDGVARRILRSALPLPVRAAGRYVRRLWRNRGSA